MASVQGEIADAIVAYLSTPAAEAQIEALIASGETSLEKLVTAGLSNLKVGGVLGIVLPALETGIEGEVAAILSKYTAAEIVTGLLIPWAQTEAKALGG